VSNLLNRAEDYQGFSVMTTAKKLHERAPSEQMSGVTPVKARCSSMLSHTPSVVMDGQASNYDSRNPYRHQKSTTQRANSLMQDNSASVLDLHGVKEGVTPSAKHKFGIEGYILPSTMHNIIKVPKW
jgi:hypothetical protein